MASAPKSARRSQGGRKRACCNPPSQVPPGWRPCRKLWRRRSCRVPLVLTKEDIEPNIRVVAAARPQGIQPAHAALGAGQHLQFAHACEIESGHYAVVGLLDEKAVR